jgi:hypothetical protein
VEALLRSQAEGYWRAFTSSERFDPAAAWRGREALLSPATLARVDAALAAAQGDEQRALRHLRAFLLGEALARDLSGATARLAAARASTTVSWGGRAVPLDRVPGLLAAEADPARRKALAEATDEAARTLVPLADAWRQALDAAARARGFAGTLPLAAVLRGADPEALERRAAAVLERTDAIWRALVGALAKRETALDASAVRARDLPRLLRSPPDGDLFPADRQVATATAALAAFGVDLPAGEVVDGGARPGKRDGVIALPVEVPGSVRVSFSPVPGLDAARALLHALGVASHYAHVKVRPVEFRRLGPEAILRASGDLVEGIAAAPQWLAEHGASRDLVAAAVRSAVARDLRAAREDAAIILYESARAREPERAAALWSPIAERALGRPTEDELPPPAIDPDPLLRAAEDLDARLLAAQLTPALDRVAGGPWWRSPRAREALRGVWAEGTRRDAGEILALLGAGPLDPSALDALARSRLEAAGAAP